MINIPDITAHDFHKYFKGCMYVNPEGGFYLLKGLDDAERYPPHLITGDTAATVIKLVTNGDLSVKWAASKKVPAQQLMRDLNVFSFPSVAGWRMAAEGKYIAHYRYVAHGGRARGFNEASYDVWIPDENKLILDTLAIDHYNLVRSVGMAFRLLKEQAFIAPREAITQILEGKILGAACSPQMAMTLSGAEDAVEFPIKIYIDRKLVGKVGANGETKSIRSETSSILDEQLNKAA